jgi:transposase
MVDSLPSSIELTPVQREILDLIIQDQATIQGPVQPERAILLWCDGISESETARRLGISEEEVRTLRNRWWESTARVAAAEKKFHKVFNDLVSLIFRVPNEETPSETALHSSAASVQATSASQGKPAGHKELRAATRALIEILHHKPKVYGINRSNWTLRSLAEAFEKHYDLRLSHTTVGRLLKEAGLSWKKSRRVLTSPDPNYREKVELLLNTLQSLKADEDLFFIDELGPLQVKRYGGRSYTPKGATPTHPQNQHSRGSITLYGALSATTNQVTWFYGKSKDSAGIIDLAEMLFNQYHAKSKIYLTWDAASWHGSDELVQWTDKLNAWNKTSAAGPMIEFVPLPSSAQFLDVIEAVFSGMKRAVIHSSDYQSEEEMKTAISTHFRERNEFFKRNPKRAGKKIWEVDFFQDHNHIRSGNYREW